MSYLLVPCAGARSNRSALTRGVFLASVFVLTACGGGGGSGGGGSDGTSDGKQSDSTATGAVRLSAENYSVGENGGSASITVERRDGSDGDLTVDYRTVELYSDRSDRAVAGEDYSDRTGTLRFSDGQMQQTFSISINNDDSDNPDLSFKVELSNASTATVSPTQAMVQIVDDDSGGGATSPGKVQFSSADYSVNEDGGSVTVAVERVNGSDGTIGVDYATDQLPTDSTNAVAGEDYASRSGRLTFDPGETRREFTVPISDDGSDNPNLDFRVALSDASSGATSPVEAIVTIVDDDQAEPDPVTLNWTAPTTREDGSALSLSQIGGYVIYSGSSANDLSQEVRIEDGSATSHTIDGLDSGTYYFAISTFDVSGAEGPRSSVVSTSVQ